MNSWIHIIKFPEKFWRDFQRINDRIPEEHLDEYARNYCWNFRETPKNREELLEELPGNFWAISGELIQEFLGKLLKQFYDKLFKKIAIRTPCRFVRIISKKSEKFFQKVAWRNPEGIFGSISNSIMGRICKGTSGGIIRKIAGKICFEFAKGIP